jgi:hypothetical protein
MTDEPDNKVGNDLTEQEAVSEKIERLLGGKK